MKIHLLGLKSFSNRVIHSLFFVFLPHQSNTYMDIWFEYFGYLGAIASILGFILAIVKKDKLRNIILYIVIAIVSGIAVWSFHLYKQENDKKLILEKREQKARMDAKILLKSSPSYISYWNPGESMGVVSSVLLLLEQYKDIWPKNYEDYREKVTLIEKEFYNDSNLKNSESIQYAGEEALQILKALAQ